jgi:hypothetical protein
MTPIRFTLSWCDSVPISSLDIRFVLNEQLDTCLASYAGCKAQSSEPFPITRFEIGFRVDQ